jgi:hypothetical protein
MSQWLELKISDEAIDALYRSLRRTPVSQAEMLENALKTYDIITAMQKDDNTFYRVNEYGDMFEIDFNERYIPEGES